MSAPSPTRCAWPPRRTRAGAGHPDDARMMTIRDRRDSFCGKMSACNNLTPVRHSILAHDACTPSAGFRSNSRKDLAWFAAVCRVVERPAQPPHRRHRRAPRRFQHRSLQRETARSAAASRSSPSISRKSSAESSGMKDDDSGVQAKLAEIREVCDHRPASPMRALVKMAKLGT